MSTQSTQRGKSSPSRQTPRRVVAAGTIGHAIEWFDFGIYAYLATIIAALFFPSDNPTASLLATLATFGAGFIARPVGALVFGRLGDRIGRRAVMLWTLLLMAVGTGGIAISPTHEQVGVLAPALLLVLRLLQGLSAGGEATTAAVFMVEWAPSHKRGLFGCFMQIGSVLGLLLASLVVALCHTVLGEAAMVAGGWRIPFAVGVLIVPVAYLIRRRTEETPSFTGKDDTAVAPATDRVAKWDVKGSVQAFLLLMFWSVGFYFFLTYMPTFLQREFGIAPPEALWVSVVAMIVHIMFVPLAAVWSDRVGRRPVMLLGCATFVLVPIPLFTYLQTHPPVGMVFVAVTAIGILLALYTGPAVATGAEFFTTSTRSSGYAIGYNISAVIFGGFTPYVSTWLIAQTNVSLAPIYYLSLTALLGGIFIWTIRETAGKDLG